MTGEHIEAPEPLPEDDRPPLVRNDSAAWAWVERHLKRELSEPHRRAVQVVCAGVAPYNLRANWKKAEWFQWGCLSIVIGGELATFDFDRLTQMVIAAHDHCMRLSVEGVGPGYLRVVIHERKARHGGIAVRHPAILDAVKRHSRVLLAEVPDAD